MITIEPYVEINGIRTFSDRALKEIYNTIKSDGSDKKLFPGSGTETADDFVVFMKNPNRSPIMILVDQKVMGIAWLSNITNTKNAHCAMAHFCFFKESWGKHTDEMAKTVIQYWMTMKNGDNFFFDVLMGSTPVENKLAVNFIQKCGFKVIGTIPYIDNGVISYITRDKL